MRKQLLKLAAVITVAAIAQKYANAAAYIERGYFAYGGEIFVFPITLVAGYYMIGIHAWVKRQKMKQKIEEERRNELRKRATDRQQIARSMRGSKGKTLWGRF